MDNSLEISSENLIGIILSSLFCENSGQIAKGLKTHSCLFAIRLCCFHAAIFQKLSSVPIFALFNTSRVTISVLFGRLFCFEMWRPQNHLFRIWGLISGLGYMMACHTALSNQGKTNHICANKRIKKWDFFIAVWNVT